MSTDEKCGELVIDAEALFRASHVMREMLPCPFCGRAQPFESTTSRSDSTFHPGKTMYQARISCMNDTGSSDRLAQSCHANVFFNAFSLEEARIGARLRWNRRDGVA